MLIIILVVLVILCTPYAIYSCMKLTTSERAYISMWPSYGLYGYLIKLYVCEHL